MVAIVEYRQPTAERQRVVYQFSERVHADSAHFSLVTHYTNQTHNCRPRDDD